MPEEIKKLDLIQDHIEYCVEERQGMFSKLETLVVIIFRKKTDGDATLMHGMVCKEPNMTLNQIEDAKYLLREWLLEQDEVKEFLNA